MDAADIVTRMTKAGFKLDAAGDKLRIHPFDRLTPKLVALLLRHKAELLSLLAAAKQGTPAKPEPAPPEKVGPQPPAVCPCGSFTWRRVVLTHEPHNGRTTRLDCALCGKFIAWDPWYRSPS